MKPLLNGQTLGIDNHRPGQPLNWDDPSADIHLDKRTNSSKTKGQAIIKIPLNSERPPYYELNGQKGDDSFKRRLEKEIHDALSNKKKREKFVTEIIERINNIESDLSNREKAQQAVRRIAKAFDLEEKIVREMAVYSDNNMLSFTSLHRDSQSRLFFIRLTRFRTWIGEVSGRYIKRILDELLL